MTDDRSSEQPAGKGTDSQDASERRGLMRLPVDGRSLSLAVLALAASVFMLRWGRKVFIPLTFGLMFSYALAPLVDRMQRWHVPRSLASGFLVLSILGGIGTLIYSLSDETTQLIESLPTAAQKLRKTLRSEQEGPIEKMQEAAIHLEQAAAETTAVPAPAMPGVQRVQIERPRFRINDYLWTGTLGLVGLIGQITVVSFLTFFMLVSGDTFRRKLAKIAGPRKENTLQALDEITDQIQRYLLVNLFTSALVGLTTWFVFLWIGVNQAAAWGVLAGVLNFVPYLGAIFVTAGAALFGFLQFGTLEMAALIGGASTVIQILEGYLLTPSLTSRASRISTVAILAGVLGWGWMWGAWGLLLGVPILMVVKVVCDRVEGLKPVGELLGE